MDKAGGTHPREGKLLGVGKVGAFGEQAVGVGGASEALEHLREVRGGGAFGRRWHSRAQLLLDTLVKASLLPVAVLLLNKTPLAHTLSHCCHGHKC